MRQRKQSSIKPEKHWIINSGSFMRKNRRFQTMGRPLIKIILRGAPMIKIKKLTKQQLHNGRREIGRYDKGMKRLRGFTEIHWSKWIKHASLGETNLKKHNV